jgi:hypothetical protein
MKRVIIDARGTPEASRLGLIVAREEDMTPEQETAWRNTLIKARADLALQDAAADRRRRKEALLDRLLDEDESKPR